MTTYIVSYDLIKQKDYEPLWAELKRLKAHRSLESFWLVELNNTAMEITTHFEKFIDADDGIWVSELTKNRHYKNARAGTNNWLTAHPPSR